MNEPEHQFFAAFRDHRRRRPLRERVFAAANGNWIVLLQFGAITACLMLTLVPTATLVLMFQGGKGEIPYFGFFPHLVLLALVLNGRWLRQMVIRPVTVSHDIGGTRLPMYLSDVIRREGVERAVARELWLAGLTCSGYFHGIATEAREDGRRLGLWRGWAVFVLGIALYLAGRPPGFLHAAAILSGIAIIAYGLYASAANLNLEETRIHLFRPLRRMMKREQGTTPYGRISTGFLNAVGFVIACLLLSFVLVLGGVFGGVVVALAMTAPDEPIFRHAEFLIAGAMWIFGLSLALSHRNRHEAILAAADEEADEDAFRDYLQEVVFE